LQEANIYRQGIRLPADQPVKLKGWRLEANAFSQVLFEEIIKYRDDKVSYCNILMSQNEYHD